MPQATKTAQATVFRCQMVEMCCLRCMGAPWSAQSCCRWRLLLPKVVEWRLYITAGACNLGRRHSLVSQNPLCLPSVPSYPPLPTAEL